MSKWYKTEELKEVTYTCGHCGAFVSPSKGYLTLSYTGSIPPYEVIGICPKCDKPTYKISTETYPASKKGMDVTGINDLELENIYDEARRTFQVNAYTSCVLCCRKA